MSRSFCVPFPIESEFRTAWTTQTVITQFTVSPRSMHSRIKTWAWVSHHKRSVYGGLNSEEITPARSLASWPTCHGLWVTYFHHLSPVSSSATAPAPACLPTCWCHDLRTEGFFSSHGTIYHANTNFSLLFVLMPKIASTTMPQRARLSTARHVWNSDP